MSTQIPSRPLLHHEINSLLAAEYARRDESVTDCSSEDDTLWFRVQDSVTFCACATFTQSLDTLAMLEKHLTPDEARCYAIECFRGCSYTEILMMAPVKRARILAQVLRGEAA